MNHDRDCVERNRKLDEADPRRAADFHFFPQDWS
jgi:hypothetical protein